MNKNTIGGKIDFKVNRTVYNTKDQRTTVQFN